jgi:hypothetical protein
VGDGPPVMSRLNVDRSEAAPAARFTLTRPARRTSADRTSCAGVAEPGLLSRAFFVLRRALDRTVFLDGEAQHRTLGRRSDLALR